MIGQRNFGRGGLAALFLFFLFSGVAEAAGPIFSQPWRKAHAHASDPALSSRFLPASIQIRDPAQGAMWRALVSRLKTDSTRHWELRDGRLKISYDMLQELAGGNLPITGGGLGDRLAAWLTRSQGGDFRSSGSAFGTYLPDDEWLLGSPQWALHNTGTTFANRPGKAGVDIGIEKVWDKFAGSDSLIVAVVDAGFDFHHPDLQGRNWINKAEAQGKPGVDDDGNGFVDDSLGWDFVENDNLPQDCHGHGTYVSSVIAAGFDNQQGIAGILAQGKIMPVRVLDASGHGDQVQIAKGILYAVHNGAKVINFSIGGDGDNTSMRNAFQAARDAGVPIVVAAGNDGLDINLQPAYPASYTFENMLVVAAHDHAGLMCGFSNYGKASVHLAAPGELILVAGLPDPKLVAHEDFEGANLRWTLSGGAATGTAPFALSTDTPVAGKQSLAWISGNNAVATFPDTIDLGQVRGASLRFRLDFKPANTSDVFIIEGNKVGTSIWTEIAVIGSVIPPTAGQGYGLQDLDGSRFILRCRTALASRFSPAGRTLKIDEIEVYIPDPNPPSAPVYTVVAGTSLAAPHVTAYVGLQRLACDRMGLPWNRARALAGVDTEAAFAGKVSSGGRLDCYKGLQFYLSTLPDFRVLDSTASTWKGGEQVAYDLSLSPSPQQAYTFSETGLPAGAGIDGAGKLTWTPNSQQAGDYTLRLRAEGPTVLRKSIRFSVQASRPVPIAAGGPDAEHEAAGIFRVMGQGFRLRPELMSGSHWVELFGTDAAGKVQLLKREWVDAAGFARKISGFAGNASGAALTRVQVRVDGIFLASSR